MGVLKGATAVFSCQGRGRGNGAMGRDWFVWLVLRACLCVSERESEREKQVPVEPERGTDNQALSWYGTLCRGKGEWKLFNRLAALKYWNGHQGSQELSHCHTLNSQSSTHLQTTILLGLHILLFGKTRSLKLGILIYITLMHDKERRERKVENSDTRLGERWMLMLFSFGMTQGTT